MTGVGGWLAVGCLVVAAGAAGWPGVGRRSRQRRVLAAARPTLGPPDRAPRVGSGTPPGRRRPSHLRWARPSPWALPGWGLAAALVAPVAGLALLAGGPVAGAAAGVYAAVGVRAARAHHHRRTTAAHRTELLDQLSSAAADLRAGLPVDTALAGAPAGVDLSAPARSLPGGTGSPRSTLADQVWAAVHLADRTGAPLAELVERIEADARSADRARAGASAQVAGARATAWLLAVLPLGGLGLGYAIGADPLPVLLRTPIGAVCALGALTLQLAGLAWTARITRPAPVAVP